MSAKRFIYVALLVTSVIDPLSGQDTLFFENFDSSPGAKPAGWTTELEAGDSKWQFVNGGGTKNPGIPGSRKPPAAYSEPVNALYFFESLEGESVILITPPVNLEFALKPELRFMHVQREGNLGFGLAHDELRVYYKTHFDSAWNEVKRIAEYTDEVYDWTEQTILLPEGAKVPECYFAFKATTKYGWGVGIDDVRVIETDFQPRVVDAVTISQEDFGILPTGSRNNPLLRVNVTVKGNSGSVTLNSLDVSSLNTSDADIRTNGVKLYYNYSNRNFFAASVLDSVSFGSGEALFTSLDLDLPTGHTSLWIGYDIKPDAVHKNLADAMLKAGSMNINGSTYPASDVSPAGNRIIRESVFLDDFSADRGWTLAGDFERDQPGGLGGKSLGNPDPLFASGDTMIMGNDLTGLGAIPGDYEPNVDRYGNLATSPAFNLYYYNDVKVNFLRWLNVANNDTASIEMSLDGGGSWEEVWSNDNNVFTDGSWKYFNLDLTGAHRQSQVNLRFNLGPTTPTDHLSGWNIENLAITGNYVEYDVGPVALLAPGTGCGHTSAETVSIRIKNFGPGATPAQIPVRYSFDGGSTFKEDVINGSMAFQGQRDFNFAEKIDLTTPGVYNVVIETALDVDEESMNNRFDTLLYVNPVYSIPYEQDFEAGSDYWRAEGINASFEYGSPVGSIIHTAASGVKAWVTNLDGTYNDNEDSYLLGPCFDFTGVDFPVFECKLFVNTEEGTDGANIEYSLDNGQSWSRLGNMGDGATYYWNWYNSNVISSLNGGHGWTGGPDTWFTARFMLNPAVFRNMPSVKFRFHFASDASGLLEGIGIDDIRIYEVPGDVGVVSIESPISGCAQDIGDHVSVTIKNYGLDTLMAGDTILVGYDLETNPTVTEMFILPGNLMSGGSMSYSFAKNLAVTSSGWKNIEAFTLLADEFDFYNDSTSNDTTAKSFEVVQTPYVFLPSAIYTVRPDTVVLDAYTGDPADTYLWQDASTDRLFNVSAMADGIYYVTASNAYCDFTDTTYVYRLIADVGVTGFLDPVSDCELGASVRPRIEVMNFGTDTLHAGDQVPVGYRINAEPVISEMALLAQQVLPDSSFEYTFSTPSDMSSGTTFSVKSFTDLAYDNALTNDTSNVIIEAFGYTPIDLGPDVIVRALQYTIDAGAGYDTYLWQDGSTGQTLLIDTTGQYRVTVKQGMMCENSDSLVVTMVIPDIGVERLFNPTDACELSVAEHLEFYVLNLGTDTLLINDTISMTYQLNGGSLMDDTLYVDRLVVPGDSILFTSGGTFDLTNTGTYQFTVDAFYSKDLVPGNNHLDQSAEIFGYPVVWLGDDQVLNAKTYTLDAGVGFISYGWQDGSANQEFVVEYGNQTPDSTYAVTVVDINGCEASDEVKIGFDLWDVGVLSVVSPASSCMLTDQEELVVVVKNFGTNPIAYNKISLVASVDAGVPITAQIGSSQILDPGDSIEYIFGFTFDFSAEGDHTVTAYSLYGQDGDPLNDTLDVTISRLGAPEPDLGGINDSLATPLPYTLDAGADFLTYLWNGVAGNRTYNATQYGWYTLEVSNLGGCTGKDSIFLMQSTGIEDFLLPGELNLYPVPASRFLHIEYRYSEVENLFLDIFDSSGRKILVKQYSNVDEITETIDVTGMAQGFYYLRLRSDERQLIRQIVIQ